MYQIKNILITCLCAASATLITACNSGGSSSPSSCNYGTAPAAPTDSNQVQIMAGCGLNNVGNNVPYVSVTICQDSSGANCQTINNVLLDTGSIGLKINQSVLNSKLLSGLTSINDTTTNLPLSSCNLYGGGYLFTNAYTATVKLGGMTSNNMPIQVINDINQSTVPASCSLVSFNNLLANSGANGVIGVNPQVFASNSHVKLYIESQAGVYTQLDYKTANSDPILNVNPIVGFAESNGLIISLPAVTANSNTNIYGVLTFGVNTRANNQINNASVQLIGNKSSELGYFKSTSTTNVTSRTIFDTGTNGYVVYGLNMAQCGNNYCPGSPTTWTSSLSNWGFDITTSYNESIQISNPVNQASAIMPNWAFVSNTPGITVYGLPFFFGKNVYAQFPTESQASPVWGY